MGTVKRTQRRDFTGNIGWRRRRQRQLRRHYAREHVMLGRPRPHFLGRLPSGNFPRRVALQDFQGARVVGRITFTSSFGLAPSALLMMSFHASSADVINPRSSANARIARVVAMTTTSSSRSL